MVDFDNEVTVGIPAANIVKILILQRRADLFEAWEKYLKHEYQGVDADMSVVRARLNSFFLELQAGLKRRLPPEEYESIMGLVESEEESNIIEAMYFLNEYLDKLKLIQIDSRKVYDKTRVEKEDKVKGI